MPRNGLQEHVFCLRTVFDNIRHESAKLFAFIDVKDAFGSLDHQIMLNGMIQAGYPQHVIEVTRDLYTNSSFQLMTASGLTNKVTRGKGIIQGCPWSVIVFIQGIDPWLRWMAHPYPDEHLPCPCQGYVDDVDMCRRSEAEMLEMIHESEQFLQDTGMQAKHRKCALVIQRSGNNWYKRSNTHRLQLVLQGDNIPVYNREQPYTYLGHSVNMNGSAYRSQLDDITYNFENNPQKISSSPLPIAAKLEAVNAILISKLNFYFCNIQFTEKLLKLFENKIVQEVRHWLALNNSCTRAFMFLPRCQGGLGLVKPATMYHAKHVTFLLSLLNSDDPKVKDSARAAFHLHMSKRKVANVR